MSERKRPDISSPFLDIDERLRVAKAKRPRSEKKEKVSVPIEHILNGVAIIDRTFEIVETNKACLETLGLADSEVIGRKCHEIFSSDRCHGNDCALKRILAGEKRVEYELRKKGRGNDAVLVRAAAAPFFDPDGEVRGMVANFQNVTKQKRTEQKTVKFDKLLKQMRQEQGRLKKSIHKLKTDSAKRNSPAPIEYEVLLSAQEELRVADEELRQQNEQLENSLLIIENEREKYQRLFEFTPFGYIVTDSAGVIQELNGNAVRLFNLSHKLLIGKPLLVLFSKESRKEFHRRLGRLQQGEDVLEWECIIQPRKKRQVPVVVTAAVSSGENEALHVHWLIRDISETKTIQEELRRKTELFERLVSCSSVGIMAFDKECRVALWNPTMERLSGLKEEHLRNKQLFECFPFLKERGDDKYLLEVLSGKTGSVQNRYFAVPETGIEGFYDAEYSPLRDEDGQILGGLVIVRNTTKRKQAEEALRQSEEKYRTLFENSVLGIFTVDLHGRYTSLNPAALRVLGYSLPEIIGQSYKNHIAPEFLHTVFREYNTLFRTERPIHNLRYDIIVKGGHRRTIESSVSLLYAKDQPIGFQSSAIDITGRKQAEEILRLSHLFLQAANKHSEMEPLLEDFIHIIKDFSGCEAVGIRVYEPEKKITHQVFSGFTEQFFESACPLSDRDNWCFCQLSTEGSTGLFDVYRLSGTEHPSARGAKNLLPPCCEFGFHAVAAIPIRVEQRLVGIIQMGISTRNGLQENMVKVLEHAINQIGTAIVRIQMNETVKLALQISHKKAEETSALLEGSRAVLEYGDFQKAAEKIVSVSRKIVGAAWGCITLVEVENDSEELIAIDSDLLFPESKGMAKFRIEGVCADVYQSRKSIFINEPDALPELDFIEKKMKLQNALIVPILLDEKTAGLLLLFNKAGAFCDEDRDLGEAFAGQASIALRNSNHIKEIKRSEARYRWLSEGLEAVVKKKVTELQQAKTLASIGQMVSIVAHEIRNPLQNIFMGVDSLKREIGDDPLKTEILAEISHGVRLLNGIVRELLDYSKPVNLIYSSWPIGKIIGTSLSLLSEKLTRVELRKQVNDPEKAVFLDGEKISRVLVNLLNNAIEAMPNEGTLSISSDFGAFNGFGLKISISDTGCGMDKETLARIEEPFYTTKMQGTGLGISICRKIVEAHGGSMCFQSEQNKGTTVDIFLPAREKMPQGKT